MIGQDGLVGREFHDRQYKRIGEDLVIEAIFFVIIIVATFGLFARQNQVIRRGGQAVRYHLEKLSYPVSIYFDKSSLFYSKIEYLEYSNIEYDLIHTVLYISN